MSTVDSKELVERIIAKKGRLYPEDSPCIKIVEYTNAWGGTCWGLVFKDDGEANYDRYEDVSNPYLGNPKVIWRKEEK